MKIEWCCSHLRKRFTYFDRNRGTDALPAGRAIDFLLSERAVLEAACRAHTTGKNCHSAVVVSVLCPPVDKIQLSVAEHSFACCFLC